MRNKVLHTIITQITVLNLVVTAVVFLLTALFITEPPYKTMLIFCLAYYILQLQIGLICFGLSAFLKNNGIGLGIGVGLGFYMINILANITEDLNFLKFITPFSYTDSATIINENSFELKYLIVGVLLAAVGVVLAFVKYTKKDIA